MLWKITTFVLIFNELIRRANVPSPDSRWQQYAQFPGLLTVDSMTIIRDLSPFKEYMLYFYLTSPFPPPLKYAKLKTLLHSEGDNTSLTYFLNKVGDSNWRRFFLPLYKELNTSLLFTSKEYTLLYQILTVLD